MILLIKWTYVVNNFVQTGPAQSADPTMQMSNLVLSASSNLHDGHWTDKMMES